MSVYGGPRACVRTAST